MSGELRLLRAILAGQSPHGHDWLRKRVAGHSMAWHLSRCGTDVGGEGRPWKNCNRVAVSCDANGINRCRRHGGAS